MNMALINKINFNFLFDFVIFTYEVGNEKLKEAYQELRVDGEMGASWIKLNASATDTLFDSVTKLRTNAHKEIGNFSVFADNSREFDKKVEKYFTNEEYWQPNK